MPPGRRSTLIALAIAVLACGTGCGVLGRAYEYEEELWLSVDGSATVDVNASLASLAALRGLDVNPDPAARPDPERIRALFSAPGLDVGRPTFFRRAGRRFVHVRVDVEEVTRLPRAAPFAWSSYRFERRGESLVFRQEVGSPAGDGVADAGWRGDELVAFRVHVPSKVLFENASSTVQRGNILTWEQLLRDRLAGAPLELRIDMEPESILYTTLILFGATVVLAAVTLSGVVWWLRRRGARTLASERAV
jgi:hypothetical protein